MPFAAERTVSEPPEYRDAADHLMSNSASSVSFVSGSNRFEVNDGSADPEAWARINTSVDEIWGSGDPPSAL